MSRREALKILIPSLPKYVVRESEFTDSLNSEGVIPPGISDQRIKASPQLSSDSFHRYVARRKDNVPGVASILEYISYPTICT